MNAQHWQTRRLGELCSKIGSGVTPRGGDSVYTTDGTALIRSQNIYNSDFASQGLAFIDDKQAERMSGVRVTEDDVLLNITGDSVARCCRVPANVLPARVNQHVSIIRTDANQLSPDFLMYYLTSPHMQASMLSLAGSGGTRKALTKRMIEDFLVPFPNFPTQERVVHLLKCYDDLISNNTRRVNLLARSARLLFEEWFIRLRYPGHEHEKIINGVPAGWERKRLSEFCARITDGSHSSPHTTEFGMPMASVKDMREWDFEMAECRLISEEDYLQLVRNDCKPLKGDILIAKDSANLNKHTFLVAIEREKVVLSSIAIIRPLDSVNAEYMMSMLKSPEVSERIKRNVSGVAIPRIVLKDFKRLPVMMPTRKIQDAWQEMCGPMNELCRSLSRANATLANARNLLLPRLMDGRIEV